MKSIVTRGWRAIRNPAARTVAATALLTYAGMALSLLSAPVLAQTIGADGRGVVAGSFALIQTLAWVGFLSLPRVLARENVGSETASKAGLLWLTLLGILNCAIVLVSADILSNGDGRIALGMRVGAVVLLLNGVGQYGVEQAIARGRIGLFNLSRVGYTIVPSMLILVFALAGNLTTTSAYMATLIGQVATTLTGMGILFFITPRFVTKETPWKGALHLWSANAIDGASGQLGQVLLAALSTAAQVGVYSIAVMLGSAAGALAQALTQVSYARFISQAKETDAGSSITLRRVSVLGVASTLVVGCVLVAFIAQFGTFFFGSTFEGLALVTAAAMVSQILSEQWSLRVMHDTAHRNVGHLALSSGVGASATAAAATALGLSGALTATTMAFALAIGAALKLLVRFLLRHRSRAAGQD